MSTGPVSLLNRAPDDLDATFHRKSQEEYQGYVTNVAESCDEGNEQQLILGIQVEPNNTDDAQMLMDAADELAERTEVETLYTDGGYNSAGVDGKLADLGIEQVQTAIRGGTSPRLGRDAFDWEMDADRRPKALTCPNGQRVAVEQGRKGHTFVARFDAEVFEQCPLRAHCPTKSPNRKQQRDLRFTLRQVQVALRQQRSRAQQQTGSNPRAAVEATIWSMKSRMRRLRSPYRGQTRVTMGMVAIAAMVNVCRLAKLDSSTTLEAEGGLHGLSNPSLGALRRLWAVASTIVAGRAFRMEPRAIAAIAA